MKRNTAFAVVILLIGVLVSGFIVNDPSAKYDYVNINQVMNTLKISSTNEAFQEINVKDLKTRDNFDFSPALIKITEYENTGWEYVESTTYSRVEWSGISIVMRRKK